MFISFPPWAEPSVGLTQPVDPGEREGPDESMTTKPEKDPVRVELELTREQAEELRARAEWQRTTVAELIRRAIDAYLKQAGHSETRSR